MVNDQLLRIHQLRLLSYEKVAAKSQAPTEDSDRTSSSPPTRNLLSSSAPETSYEDPNRLGLAAAAAATTGGLEQQQQQVAGQANKRLKSLSKSQNSSPTRDYNSSGQSKENQSAASNNHHRHHNLNLNLIHNHNHNHNRNHNHHHQQSKRRSSWRNLLSPNYRSRSDEFHKLFADRIPKNERLIADYACALHRDILIQGRVYISVNYVAFYSNLFSWITKLVVRLRDIREICKANTARIIPNAIQVVTKAGEKHVFASFVARDKSYLMILRIWQNNLMEERMTDDEIRNLVHLGYGKDLGMSDNEELKINSVEPRTPSNVGEPPAPSQQQVAPDGPAKAAVDGNNNSDDNDTDRAKQRGHSRYNSLDYRNQPEAAGESASQDEVMSSLAARLGDLSDSFKEAHCDHEDPNSSPAASSAVVVDTPEMGPVGSRGRQDSGAGASSGMDRKDNLQATGSNRHSLATNSSLETEVAVSEPDDHHDHNLEEGADQRLGQASSLANISPSCCQDHLGELIDDQQLECNVDTLFRLIFTNSKFMHNHMTRRGMIDATISQWRRVHHRRAGSGTGSGAGNNSNSRSSTLSSCSSSTNTTAEREGGSAPADPSASQRPVKLRQFRQLNYSMNINHLWAKQVRIEERQSILRASKGLVYVLQTQAINSGIPYGESFSVDITYCLTRAGQPNRSRMLVHALVNFNKDKQNWRLAFVKSLIERQSIQGVSEFVADLANSIREHLCRRSRSSLGSIHRPGPLASDASSAPARTRRGSSLVRAKSKLKERKLRNMYKYYIRDQDVEAQRQRQGGPGALCGEQVVGGLGEPAELDEDEEGQGSSSCGSSLLSIDGSMMMMMATHDTDSQVSSSNAADRKQPRARLAPSGRRLRRLGGRSFSDLDDDLDGGDGDDDDYGDDDEDDAENIGRTNQQLGRRRRRARRADDHLSDGGASNATLNNGNIAGAAGRQRIGSGGNGCDLSGAGGSGWRAEAERSLESGAGRRVGKVESGAGWGGRPERGLGRLLRTGRLRIDRLLTVNGLASLTVLVLLLMVALVIGSQVLILRRLEAIEERLQVSCRPGRAGLGS